MKTKIAISMLVMGSLLAGEVRVTDYNPSASDSASVVVKKTVQRREIPLQISDMPLNDFISVMAQQAGYSYVANPNVAGSKVDGVFYAADPVECARQAAKVNGFNLVDHDGVLEVNSPKIEETAPRSDLIYKLKYFRIANGKVEEQQKKTEDYFTALLGLETSKGDNLKYDVKSSTLVIHTTESKRDRLSNILVSIDIKRPLITTEVDVYEVNTNPHKLMGLDWQSLTSQGITMSTVNKIASQVTSGYMPFAGVAPQYGLVFQPDQVRVVLHALETKGLSRNLTRMIASGEQAETHKVSFARSEPIPQLQLNPTTGAYDSNSFQFLDIGDILEMQATLLDNENVRILLKPTVSTSNQSRTFTSGSASGGLSVAIPVVKKRQAEMTVYCRLDRSLIIGGMKEGSETDNSNRVPLLGNILPYLFSSSDRQRNDTSVVIVVTPKQVTEDMVTESMDADTQKNKIAHDGENKDKKGLIGTIRGPGHGGFYDEADKNNRNEWDSNSKPTATQQQ